MWIRDNWEISFASVKQAFFFWSPLFLATEMRKVCVWIQTVLLLGTRLRWAMNICSLSRKGVLSFTCDTIVHFCGSVKVPCRYHISVPCFFLRRFSLCYAVPALHWWLNVSVAERLIGGHPLWTVNWMPQEESYQHNMSPFSDICHILWTHSALVSSFERGPVSLCLLCVKIRVSVRANSEAQWQPGTPDRRGWMRCVWKGNYQYRIRHSWRQQLPAGYWLITEEIKDFFRMHLSRSHLEGPQT